jgi:hypothetical protein
MSEEMEIGFIMGQYPEKNDQVASMSDQEIYNQFYPGIERKCPQFSFGVKQSWRERCSAAMLQSGE